jgi:tetratricopeptide (TPR) repeat protein
MPRKRNIGGLLLTCVFFGCSISPKDQEAKFLRKGDALMARNDLARALLEFRNAARTMPGDAEPYYRIALVSLKTGNIAGAYAELTRALELNPNHIEAQLKIAGVMAASADPGLIQEGEQRLKRIVVAFPDSSEAMDMLAIAELRLRKPGDAAKRLEEALAKFPKDVDASVMLTQLRLLQNDTRGAEEILRKAVASAPDSANAAVALGQFYLVTGRPADAEVEFRRSLNVDPKYAPALLSLGASQVADGAMEEAEKTYRILSSLPERSYRPLYALLLFAERKTAAAVQEFARIARENPDDRDARTRLVAAYLAANQVQEAVAVLQQALAQNPNDADALFMRSQINLRSNRIDEAQSDLLRVLHFRPDSAEAHFALAKVHERQGMGRQSLTELNEALRLDPELFVARVNLATALLAGGKSATALGILAETPPAQKANGAFVVERNWALLASGRSEEFRAGVSEGLAKFAHPDLLLQKALLQMHGRDFANARLTAEKLLLDNPENIRAARILADSYVLQGDVATGLQKLRQLLAHRPRSARLQVLLGQFLAGTGSHSDARASFAAALAIDANYLEAATALIELDLDSGQIGAARVRVSSLSSAHPRDATAWLLAAKVEQRANNPQGVISAYRKVLEIDGSNVVALNNLANLMASTDVDDALKLAQSALEAAPDDHGVQDTLGWIYYRKGLYRNAVTYLKSASAGQVTPLRQYHLGMVYLKLGDVELGTRLVRKAIQDDPRLSRFPEGP